MTLFGFITDESGKGFLEDQNSGKAPRTYIGLFKDCTREKLGGKKTVSLKSSLLSIFTIQF